MTIFQIGLFQSMGSSYSATLPEQEEAAAANQEESTITNQSSSSFMISEIDSDTDSERSLPEEDLEEEIQESNEIDNDEGDNDSAVENNNSDMEMQIMEGESSDEGPPPLVLREFDYDSSSNSQEEEECDNQEEPALDESSTNTEFSMEPAIREALHAQTESIEETSVIDVDARTCTSYDSDEEEEEEQDEIIPLWEPPPMPVEDPPPLPSSPEHSAISYEGFEYETTIQPSTPSYNDEDDSDSESNSRDVLEQSSNDRLANFFRDLTLDEDDAANYRGGRSVVSNDFSTYTDAATVSSMENESFVPQHSRNYEWMGRSLESLLSGVGSVAPILGTPRRKKRRSKRRGTDKYRKNNPDEQESELTSSPHSSPTSKLLRRRSSTSSPTGKVRRRSLERLVEPFGPSSSHRSWSEHNRIDGIQQRKRRGPNVALHLLAREATGKRIVGRNNKLPAPDRLRALGGSSLYDALDKPSGGMCNEVMALEEAIDGGDWIKTQSIISRLSPRLIGDPTAAYLNSSNGGSPNRGNDNDPNLPPTAPKFYAGGGRIGLERDAFVLAGGIDVLVRIFREPCFVGLDMSLSYDARDLSKELVTTNRLGHCWNESLACLRELIYSMPSLLHTEKIFDHSKDDFVPFLFTLLSHDQFFDGAAALIEEILSLQSHSPPPEDIQDAAAARNESNSSDNNNNENNNSCECDETCGLSTSLSKDSMHSTDNDPADGFPSAGPTVRVPPPTTFFLGNVSDLYTLWGGFNCRQLAHFCRILALLIFEPEDRQLLESPAVLKSIELLQLRRNRAARAGRDSTVDMNQSILLGDENFVKKFLHLLTIMNFAPPLRCSSSFHIMAHFPYIADTLMMLGLHELDDWDDVARYETLARKSLSSSTSGERKALHDLGSVAGMLENLSEAFLNNEGEPTNQLTHIITVITAAQQAGVVIGRPRRRDGSRSSSSREEDSPSTTPRREPGMDGLTSAAGVFTDQVLLRRQEPPTSEGSGRSRPRVTTSGDAANVMQFNSLLLAPYQVEVLFVLCTLLGGRRKFDAQELLKSSGITRILDDMFQRLPWDSLSPTREPIRRRDAANSSAADQPGIHGPGCECTPESALCVQYLRLLHNFCDRDCDNYSGRRLLLSPMERRFIFQDCHVGSTENEISTLSPGLLSKVVAAFIGESDESPYRFWLASCVESFLRGSSSIEQVFVAKTGLVGHLIEDITSQRLHCAGSLQTSFDLLGELCKGNVEVLSLLVGCIGNEEKFRKLMSVASSNLVDSNVFIRSLLLSLERMSHGSEFHDIGRSNSFCDSNSNDEWYRVNNVHSRGFLTHSWWDTSLETPSNSTKEEPLDRYAGATSCEMQRDKMRASDWFPAVENRARVSTEATSKNDSSEDFREGRFGWVFKPERISTSSLEEQCPPDTIDRMFWFLTTNRTRLLRDLLEVVNLNNINHENICCLNTAVVITIFANRRGELHELLHELKQMSDEDQKANSYHSKLSPERQGGSDSSGFHKPDILQNFREVLWFWVEYYTHRGRDRLSLEFSSRLRFHEWMEVVTLLAADNGAPTALVRRPLPLPQSPYQRIA